MTRMVTPRTSRGRWVRRLLDLRPSSCPTDTPNCVNLPPSRVVAPFFIKTEQELEFGAVTGLGSEGSRTR